MAQDRRNIQERTIDEMESAVRKVAREAREAARVLALATTERKNAALKAIAAALNRNKTKILDANAADVADAEKAGQSAAVIDRLTLDEKRLTDMIASVEAVIALPDPVGEVIRTIERPNGLRIRKVRVPLGVVGIIYESRPNVTSECGSLCVKSGNAVLLRGGSESFRSNEAIREALQEGLRAAGLPQACISTIPIKERSGVDVMLRLEGEIDVIIPRGGESLIRKIAAESRIAVIKHAKGVCHVFVDEAADFDMAEAIALNAKCQRPATCNAMETLLVHEKAAQAFLPRVIRRLREAKVEVRGCERTRAVVADVKPATEEDWYAEYLDLILAIRVVPNVDAAMEHIRTYGSAHSDAIVTEDKAHAERFLRGVDSAAVYVNASTRFTDGFQFGLGAEMGISTDRLHARGPMGLEELTTYKYVVYGSGQLRP